MAQGKPYLVQRLKKQFEGVEKVGVDGLFRMDYMGSAEFEYGALPKALKAMRDNEGAIFTPIDSEGMVAYFVGLKEDVEKAEVFFTAQLKEDRSYHLKESSSLWNAYYGDKTWYKDLVGWWAIDQDCPWAIFKTDEDARKFKEAVWGLDPNSAKANKQVKKLKHIKGV